MTITVVQYFDTPNIPKAYSDLMDGIKSKTIESGNIYKCVVGKPEYLANYKHDRFHGSMVVRLWELSNNENCIWLDCDCAIKTDELFTFAYDIDLPYVLRTSCHVAAVYNNGHPEVFKKILDDVDNIKPCACSYVKKHRNEFAFFPDSFLAHKRLMGNGR